MSTAGELAAKAAKTLFDETGDRWSEAELIGYLTEAQQLVCLLKPTAYTLNVSVQLVAGTLQTIPASGVLLVDLAYNRGANGSVPGRGITQVARKMLESYKPTWRTDPAAGEVKHFVFDERDPTHFEVYPAQPSPAHYVQLSHAAVPPALVNGASVIQLSAIYELPLIYLALSRAYSKSSASQDVARGMTYLDIAQRLITGRKVSAAELHPRETQERANR